MVREHPAITRTLRTGYPDEIEETVCDECGETIPAEETYGEFEGRCVCVYCMEAEWADLPIKEKFELLGYMTEKII